MTLARNPMPPRKSPLKAKAVQMRQGAPIPARSKRTKADEPRRRDVRAEVRERDQTCALIALLPGHECFGPGETHHVLKASRGGKYSLENGRLLCSAGNVWVENEPIQAEALGLSLPSGPCAKSILLIDREESALSEDAKFHGHFLDNLAVHFHAHPGIDIDDPHVGCGVVRSFGGQELWRRGRRLPGEMTMLDLIRSDRYAEGGA